MCWKPGGLGRWRKKGIPFFKKIGIVAAVATVVATVPCLSLSVVPFVVVVAVSYSPPLLRRHLWKEMDFWEEQDLRLLFCYVDVYYVIMYVVRSFTRSFIRPRIHLFIHSFID
jgi:hypothetical protein